MPPRRGMNCLSWPACFKTHSSSRPWASTGRWSVSQPNPHPPNQRPQTPLKLPMRWWRSCSMHSLRTPPTCWKCCQHQAFGWVETSTIHFILFFFFLAHQSWKPKWASLIAFCLLSICLLVCLLYTFSSSPQPLTQFQQNLAQSILNWRRFKYNQMLGHTLFQGEIRAI